MKTFLAQIGAREFIVAAEDRGAAMERFGLEARLCEDEDVVEVSDPELVAHAAESAGQVFERPLWARRKFYTPRAE